MVKFGEKPCPALTFRGTVRATSPLGEDVQCKGAWDEVMVGDV